MPQPLLSADQILAAPDLDEETVEVPEWPNEDGSPGHVRIQQMTADENIAWTKDMQNPDIAGPEGENGMFVMLVYSAKDANGDRVFASLDVVQQLRQKNFHVLDRLQRVGIRLNRMSTTAREELKKDSGGTATEGSPTD